MVRPYPCLRKRMKLRQLAILRQQRAETAILENLPNFTREEIESLRGFCVPVEKLRKLLLEHS